MNLIAHRCVCGDLEFAHWSTPTPGQMGRCGNLKCPKRCQSFRDDGAGPEVVPLFTVNGQRADPIEPGQVWNEGVGVHSFATCGCDECRVLYRAAVA